MAKATWVRETMSTLVFDVLLGVMIAGAIVVGFRQAYRRQMDEIASWDEHLAELAAKRSAVQPPSAPGTTTPLWDELR